MDELRDAINEIDNSHDPGTEELGRAARSIQDGLRRLEYLLYARRQASTAEDRRRWEVMIEATRHGRRKAARAVRALWQA